MAPYCETTDLQHGDLAIPNYISLETYVADAADEMDAVLGQVYVTPIIVSASVPAERPSALLLKQINWKIATGRLVMFLAASSQDQEVHAYGIYLLREAQALLEKIMSGEFTLVGADKLPPGPDPRDSRGPSILNEDASSLVQDFYTSMTPTLTGLSRRPTGVRPYDNIEN